MIDPKELRIGNIVLYDSIVMPPNFILAQPTLLSEFPPKKMFEHPELCPFAPVPLTEEWLLKFGFEKSLDEFRLYFLDYCSINFDRFFNCEFAAGQWIDGDVQPLEIKHVHKLQNLYFALTGEELTLKQPATT